MGVSAKKDYLGVKWNDFEVIASAPSRVNASGRKYVQWLVRCNLCGVTFCKDAGAIKERRSVKCPNFPKCFRVDATKCLPIGSRFGRLVITSLPVKSLVGQKVKYCVWKYACKCDCGNTIEVIGTSLQSGHTQSCGCYHVDQCKLNQFTSLVGIISGFLVVKEYIKGTTTTKPMWKCYCDPELGGCGNYCEVDSYSLSHNRRMSCGCYFQSETFKQRVRGTNNLSYKHGQTPYINTVRDYIRRSGWRQQCFKRDNYTCQFSGKRGGDLQVHHITSFAQMFKDYHLKEGVDLTNYPQLLNLSNGITLAKDWHLQGSTHNEGSYHNVYGKVNCNKESFYEWFSNRPYKEGRIMKGEN